MPPHTTAVLVRLVKLAVGVFITWNALHHQQLCVTQ